MKKAILSFLLGLLGSSIILQAQAPTFDWAYQMNASRWSEPADISSNRFSEIYSIGHFDTIVDLAPGNASQILKGKPNFSSAYLQKVDSSGNLIWGMPLRGHEVMPNRIISDQALNIYIGGSFSDTLFYDPNSTTNYHTSIGESAYIQKLDSAGNLLWSFALADSSYSFIEDIALDQQENLYCLGRINGGHDFDPGPAAVFRSGTLSFLAKYDAAGNFQWVKTWSGIVSVRRMSFDHLGHLYIGGVFRDTVDFNPEPNQTEIKVSTMGNLGAFILRMDSLDQFEWVNIMQGSQAADETWLSALTTDATGASYSCGWFNGSIDFDPSSQSLLKSTPSHQIFHLYVQKFDTNGQLLWVKTLGNATGYADAKDVIVDEGENVFVTGRVIGAMDYDPDSGVVMGQNGGYLLKLNAYGQYKWHQVVVGSLTAGAHLVLDEDNNVYKQGEFRGSRDFNPGPDSLIMTAAPFGEDIYVQKFYNCPINTTISQQAFQLTSNQLNATAYQWLDCANNYAPIAGATAATYTASANGSYAVAINQNGCTDTSNCVSIIGVGIKEAMNAGIALTLLPNPSNGNSVLQIESSQPQNFELRIYHQSGALVEKQQQALKVGLNRIELNSQELPQGIYSLQLLGQDFNATQKWVVIK